MNIDTTADLKIKFKGEKQRYTVQAAGKRYLVCTKPFNARKTVLYTIIDLKEEVRTESSQFIEIRSSVASTCDYIITMLEKAQNMDGFSKIPLDIEEVYARYR